MKYNGFLLAVGVWFFCIWWRCYRYWTTDATIIWQYSMPLITKLFMARYSSMPISILQSILLIRNGHHQNPPPPPPPLLSLISQMWVSTVCVAKNTSLLSQSLPITPAPMKLSILESFSVRNARPSSTHVQSWNITTARKIITAWSVIFTLIRLTMPWNIHVMNKMKIMGRNPWREKIYK